MSLVPDHRRDAVATALHGVFGSRILGPFTPISGGVSGASILRFEDGDRPYLLRLEPQRIAQPHRERHFSCMRAAADVGAAPRVHYADAVEGIAIVDFIAGRPLEQHPGGATGLVRALGVLISRVQQTPLFPSFGGYPQWIDDKLVAIDAAGHFSPGLLSAHRDGLARIRESWRAQPSVSAHNDPNPRNLLFDGEKLWLIDWELAFANDPLVDVAIVTLDLAGTPELEAILLQSAFGRAPDGALRARLHVTRLLTRLYYGAIVLESLPAPVEPDASLDAFTPAEFRAAVVDGRLKPGTAEIARAFAKMSLRAFVDGMRDSRSEEMLKRLHGEGAQL